MLFKIDKIIIRVLIWYKNLKFKSKIKNKKEMINKLNKRMKKIDIRKR